MKNFDYRYYLLTICTELQLNTAQIHSLPCRCQKFKLTISWTKFQQNVNNPILKHCLQVSGQYTNKCKSYGRSKFCKSPNIYIAAAMTVGNTFPEEEWFTRSEYRNYQVLSHQYLLCCDLYLQFSILSMDYIVTQRDLAPFFGKLSVTTVPIFLPRERPAHFPI